MSSHKRVHLYDQLCTRLTLTQTVYSTPAQRCPKSRATFGLECIAHIDCAVDYTLKKKGETIHAHRKSFFRLLSYNFFGPSVCYTSLLPINVRMCALCVPLKCRADIESRTAHVSHSFGKFSMLRFPLLLLLDVCFMHILWLDKCAGGRCMTWLSDFIFAGRFVCLAPSELWKIRLTTSNINTRFIQQQTT